MEYNTVQGSIRAIETIEFNAKDENSACLFSSGKFQHWPGLNFGKLSFW